MKNSEDNIIEQKYRDYINNLNIKNLSLKLFLVSAILIYFAYSDISFRHNYYSFYFRIPAIFLAIVLLIFNIFTKEKFTWLKSKWYNIFLASVIIMAYGATYYRIGTSAVASAVSGTILIMFLVSLDIKTNTLNTALIYFLPALIFLFLLIRQDVSKEDYLVLSNIFPMIILGFAVNRIQDRLRYKAFVSTYLLEKEKEKTQELYEKTLEINDDLQKKNEEIKAQRDEIEHQKNQIETQHHHITESINYAKKIQQAMLPAEKIFKQHFKEYFIFYKPREIVSGDFYWADKYGDKIILAAADCTGHGVPGAMLSMLGISLLNKITTQQTTYVASEILQILRQETKTTLKQSSEFNSSSKDGMDIALIIIDTKSLQLQYSGAYNSIYIVRKNQIFQLKADRQPIGVFIREKQFTNHTFQLQKNDIIYAFSDGMADQFNQDSQKFSVKRFRDLIMSISTQPLNEQKSILQDTFSHWKSTARQTDDILVMGLKV